MSDCGGYGDIASGIDICEKLSKSKIHHDPTFNTMSALFKFQEMTGSDKMWPLYEDIKDKEQITICVTDDWLRTKNETPPPTLYVREYNTPSFANITDLNGNLIEVKTGFSSFHKYMDIQACVYEKKHLEEKLIEIEDYMRTDELPYLKEKFLNQLVKKYGDGCENKVTKKLTQSDWAVFYPSVLNTSWFILNVVKEAENHLEKPLVILCPTPNENRSKLKRQSERFNFNYSTLLRDIKKTDSNIKILELGTITDKEFQELIALSNKASLITGDHSLSMMIQKSRSQNPAPFFYLTADWKTGLAFSTDLLLRQTSEHCANLFGNFVHQSDGYITSGQIRDNSLQKKDMARLFYDQNLIDEFNHATSMFKEICINERKKYNVAKAKTLWSIQDTVDSIVKDLLEGADIEEAIHPFQSRN